MRALLSPGERKSMEPLSRRAGLDPNVFQNYISDAPWSDVKIARINIRALHEENLADPNAVIVFDDTGFPKQGSKSPGVGRQYSGTIGRVGNCQVAVAGFYIVPGRTKNRNALRWPLGGRLYLPKDWIEDRARRRRAAIPDDVVFKTKLELALDILDQARAERVPHRCVTADEAYGNGRDFREALRARNEPYVLALSVDMSRLIPEAMPVAVPTHGRGPRPRYLRYPEGVAARSPREWAKALPRRDWKALKWSEGTKGKLQGRFARVRVRVVEPRNDRRANDETGWLLLEDSPQRLKAWLCWGLDEATLPELSRMAHARGMIEQAFEEMKEELGLDHFEGRKWRGFHHHMTMVFLAYSYLQWLRASGKMKGDLPTIAEVRAHVVLRAFKQQLIGDGWSDREAEEITNQAAPYLVGG